MYERSLHRQHGGGHGRPAPEPGAVHRRSRTPPGGRRRRLLLQRQRPRQQALRCLAALAGGRACCGTPNWPADWVIPLSSFVEARLVNESGDRWKGQPLTLAGASQPCDIPYAVPRAFSIRASGFDPSPKRDAMPGTPRFRALPALRIPPGRSTATRLDSERDVAGGPEWPIHEVRPPGFAGDLGRIGRGLGRMREGRCPGVPCASTRRRMGRSALRLDRRLRGSGHAWERTAAQSV